MKKLFSQQFCFILQVKEIRAPLANLGITDSKLKVKDIKVSQMVMSIVGIFVLCNVFQLMFFLSITASHYSFTTYIFWLLAWLFCAINSSINTLVYGIFCKKFRKLFLIYFCLKSSKWAEVSHSNEKAKHLRSNDSRSLSMSRQSSMSLSALPQSQTKQICNSPQIK